MTNFHACKPSYIDVSIFKVHDEASVHQSGLHVQLLNKIHLLRLNNLFSIHFRIIHNVI